MRIATVGKINCCLAKFCRERCPQRSVRKFDLDGQIFCIFHAAVQIMLRFALGTLRTAFPTGAVIIVR